MGIDHEGRRLTRRAVFAGVGSLGLGGLLAACAGTPPRPATISAGSTVAPQPSEQDSLFGDANACKLSPSTPQGSFYFDADKIRSDIREDRDGTRLRLALKVQDSETCTPLPNAVVEIWHCDADGVYSGATAAPTASSGDLKPTGDQRFLRGAQVTGADGVVQFITIWPGWSSGRTVHVHVMVHLSRQRVLTTQLMFDEELNSKVLAASPYNAHTGRDTFNSNDPVFTEAMLMKVIAENAGYLGVHVLAADIDHDGR